MAGRNERRAGADQAVRLDQGQPEDWRQGDAPGPSGEKRRAVHQHGQESQHAPHGHRQGHFGACGTVTGRAGNASAISADGNTVAVGAPHENSGAKGINGNQNDKSVYSAGAVYVFTRQGNNLVQQAYVKASNPMESANFGSSVALSRDGNTMAVAAYYESSAATGINGNQNDHSIPEAGAVYVFTRTGTSWSQQAYIKASNTGTAAV